jgi:hypothetical protein
MYRLFARSEANDDEANDTAIDLTEESVGETKEDGVIDLTGSSGKTKEGKQKTGETTTLPIDLTEDDVIDLTGSSGETTTLPYFESQVETLCTLHSINNAIGYKLIDQTSICENEQGKKDRLESQNKMYSIMEAANTVAAKSDLQVVRLDKLFETPETMLTFEQLKNWTVDSENPRVKNMIVMWEIPYFHMIALRYFENKWWLLDSETNPVSLNKANFDSIMLKKDAVLSLQVIYTVVPKTQQIHDHHHPNPDDPIVLE